ncbi:CHAT domain-containing protein [Rhizobacter sp. LjRoot28]|uniref:CHAT domain-containing protein n=1 Tax=Rhizobacter sp. LjRoot28 TaxID=3342309 RepID=UPI003ED0A420
MASTRLSLHALCRAACLVATVALLTPAGAQTPASPSPLAPRSAVMDHALARQRDAETLVALSAEGRALYERDVIKLDGYAYCGAALALAEQGEFRQSIRAASKALHLGNVQGNDDLKAVAQRDLAIAYSYAGLLDEAERHARGALAMTANDPQQAHAPAHKVLGDVASRRGRFDEAAAAYERALALASARYRPLVLISMANTATRAGRPAEAQALLDRIVPAEADAFAPFHRRSRANALLAAGQPDQALPLFRAAGSAPGADAAYHRLWSSEGVARVALFRGDKPTALAAYLDTVRQAESLRGRFQSEEFKTGLFSDVQQVFDAALALSLDSGDFNAAWELSEASRARQLLDAVRGRASDQFAGQRVALADLQSALPEGEAVLQFHVLDEHSIVWLITRQGVQGMRLAVGEAALATQVETLRTSIVERRRDTATLAQGLYRQLLGGLSTPLPRRVHIVPHGPLHYLPFQALHDGRGYLIERTAMAVWPSAAVGAGLLARTAPAEVSLAAFGNPSTDRNVPLPGAEREARRVAGMFDRSDVYVQHDATRARFREGAGRASVLHVAAHAEVDAVDPMFSRILFAATPTDPGLLEARDIYGLDLRAVGLITLSACESGLGKVARGDEIIGFTRSLLSAGASSIVASLWPVADESTDLLMGRLYTDLAAGRDLMTGMQHAQLEVQRNRRFAHPFFWAPFNVIGNGRMVAAARPASR